MANNAISSEEIEAVFPKVAETMADPRGKIVENARGDLPESEFEQKGIVTEKGLAQLKAYLSEVPPERFKTPMKVADIPRLFTPETFCKLVINAQRESAAA